MIRFRDSFFRLLPAAAALSLFFLVSAVCFAPQFRGEVLPRHDVQQYESMVQEIRNNRAREGEDPQWAGRIFGGMPAYLISVAYPAQAVKNTVGRVTELIDTPAGFLFFAMTAMWAMLLMMGVNPWVGIVPALMYGLSTYFFLIIGAGHVTKMWAAVYAPPMVGGVWLALRGNLWLGAALAALFASLEIGANHPQITYYFLLAMAALWISEGIAALRGRRMADFARRTAVLLAAGVLAVGSNFSPLWYTMRHSGQTIRGGSELACDDAAPAGGLDLRYATAWSYGRAESWNMLIPDFMGGDSGRSLPADGKTAEALRPYGLEGIAPQLPAYWGDQPYTAGPTYLGAATLFLALLGLLLADGRSRWWIAAVSLLALLLAWGHHFMAFTELAFRLLPGYNKFRTVSMALVAVQWTAPLLAALALQPLWNGCVERRRLLRALAWAGGLTGGVCLLFFVAGGALFDFGRTEAAGFMGEQYYRMFREAGMTDAIAQGMPEELGLITADAMAADRAAMMRADAARSLLMVALAAGAVALLAFGKIRRGAAVALLGAVVLFDLLPVGLRFLPYDRFVAARRTEVRPSEADRMILRDTEPGFRVLDLTTDPFNDARACRFHRSVGGYHGAKLARYQDLIDRYLSSLDEGVLDMLNTRYVIHTDRGGEPVARIRTSAFGPAWLVGRIVPAASPEEEIAALGGSDLRHAAVVNLGEFGLENPSVGGAGEIRLAEYRPNYLRYEYEADAPALAVFSEIYCKEGWTARIDGEEAPYFRADYLLRAMELPAGAHTVEWSFRAPGWRTAEAVTLVCSLLVLLGTALAVIYVLRHERRQKTQA